VLKVKGLLLAAVMMTATALPSAAQDLGLGLSLMGDDRGPGVIVDLSGPLKSSAGDYLLHWVGDFSYNQKSYETGVSDIDASVSTLLAQGGLRIKGRAGEKVNWHAQGLVGIIRTNVSADVSGESEEICDAFGLDCDAGFSDTGGVLTLGGAFQYSMNERNGFRAQLDFPIALGADGGSTTRFSLMYVRKLGGN
jgi:hypothetical protein